MSEVSKLDPHMAVRDAESGVLWHEASKLTVEGKGWLYTEGPYDRLPLKAKGLVPDPVWGLSKCSAGVSIRFLTDAESISVKWSGGGAMDHMPATGVSGLDLYAKIDGVWRYRATARPEPKETSRTLARNAGQGERELVLNLPLYNETKKLEIGVPEGSFLAPAPKRPSKPIVFYGTSITQGGCASRPGTAYVSILSRRLDREAINLGFSGNGKMETELAELISEIDAGLYVLDCLWNMPPEMVVERFEPFVRLLRRKRPETPILALEDVMFDDHGPTPKGVIIRRSIEKLKAEGLDRLFFKDSKGLLGTDFEGTVDACHPTDLGFMRIAEGLLPAIEGVLAAP